MDEGIVIQGTCFHRNKDIDKRIELAEFVKNDILMDCRLEPNP